MDVDKQTDIYIYIYNINIDIDTDIDTYIIDIIDVDIDIEIMGMHCPRVLQSEHHTPRASHAHTQQG